MVSAVATALQLVAFCATATLLLASASVTAQKTVRDAADIQKSTVRVVRINGLRPYEALGTDCLHAERASPEATSEWRQWAHTMQNTTTRAVDAAERRKQEA